MTTPTTLQTECWNPADIFPDDDAFEASRARLEARLAGLDRWQGRLAEGAPVLAEALEEIISAYEQLGLLRSFAGMKSDEDTRRPRYQALRQTVDFLATELSARVSWLRPEILALPAGRTEDYVRDEPRLGPYEFFLRDLLRRRDHVRDPGEEAILSASGLMAGTPPSVYNVLHNAEMPRPELALSGGRTVRLSPTEFHKNRTTPVRADRQALFPAYFGAYRVFRDTLGQNLYGALKSHVFLARSRNYPSCLAAALHDDNIPLRVYDNLIEQVRLHLPVIHRYYRLRARALGLERLDYVDLYCPISRADPVSYTPSQARERVVESLEPLGPVYRSALEQAFSERWIDWHPAEGKRAGAYANGSAYSVHPFVLLNFNGDFESLSTLTHEMGHAMHSFFSNRTQPYATADYSIFVAEVASTLNENLLLRRLLDTADDRDSRLFLLGAYLDGMRGTLFRQTMFAEFELQIHQRAERGEALTGEGLSQLYLETLRAYQGHDDGVMQIADDYAIEWASIPHFYYNFYVYQYATGIIAATALGEAILDRGSSAAECYLEFLHSGGSDYPLELLRRAGVDLESDEPYSAAFAAVERRLDDLEELLPAP